jgi:hypothetical protein
MSGRSRFAKAIVELFGAVFASLSRRQGVRQAGKNRIVLCGERYLMQCSARWVVATALLVAAPAWAADAGYKISQAKMPAPKEIHESIRKLLRDDSIKLLDAKGTVLCELWLARAVPAKATPEQIKNGLTYREVDESAVMGAIRLEQEMTDYRKQKIKPGVYTLRLGFQPMDGDHMGTAPYSEFCLLVPAKLDQKPDLIESKALRELSAKSAGSSHPGVLLLFPAEKPEDTPKLVNKGEDTWVVSVREPVTVDGKKAEGGLGVALTLIGHTTAE